jgi:uncharacterized membrane protein
MDQPDLLVSSSGNNLNQQNLPNATVALVLGIISIIGSVCYGIVGLICGIVGLILANKDRKMYQAAPELYAASSFGTSNAGRTCCIIGIILSSLLILVIILVFVWFMFSNYSNKPTTLSYF